MMYAIFLRILLGALFLYLPIFVESCSSDFGLRDSVCVLFSNSDPKCWGRNDKGQLGYESTNHVGDDVYELGIYLPTIDLGGVGTVSRLSSRYDHTCALFSPSFLIKCWGDNQYGQLGYGDTNERGDDPGEMGDYLKEVSLGSGTEVSQIKVGTGHSCSKSSFGFLKCWGLNPDGQLGYEDSSSRGDGANQMGDYLEVVNVGSGVVIQDLFLGGFQTCITTSTLNLKCFGLGFFGNLGYGDIESRGDESLEMGDYLPYINLGLGVEVTKLANFQSSTCIISSQLFLKCFGLNPLGQLGYGDGSDRGDDPGEMGEYLPIVLLGVGRTVLDVALGNSHTVFFLFIFFFINFSQVLSKAFK